MVPAHTPLWINTQSINHETGGVDFPANYISNRAFRLRKHSHCKSGLPSAYHLPGTQRPGPALSPSILEILLEGKFLGTPRDDDYYYSTTPPEQKSAGTCLDTSGGL